MPLFDLNDGLALGIISAEGVLLVAGVALLGHVWKRLTDVEAEQRQLWAAREGDAVTKRAMGDHIDVLEDHIWQRKPPPPPSRPPGV